MAAALVLAQLRAHMALPDYADQPTLGLVYITDHYAPHAQALLDHLRAELPQVRDWSGTVGVGIASNNVEYFDEPALAVMLCELPAEHYRLFSGLQPLGADGFEAHTALVHADPDTPDLGELVAEMADRTASGYLFGGLAASRAGVVQFAHARQDAASAPGVFSGGLSGVGFAASVGLMSRVTQGCRPVSGEHTVTACEGHVVTGLDDEPALGLMLRELGVSLADPQPALEKVRRTLVGLRAAQDAGGDALLRRAGQFGADTWVRHIIGLDPARQGIAVAEAVEPGMRLSFCERHLQAARSDLVRVCAEIREELEAAELPLELARELHPAEDAQAAPHPARRIAGAIYVSCSGRGGPHFGGPSAELQVVRHALGDVPLVGFFAAGEIGRRHVYGYTGVLTVFTAD